MEKRSDGKAGYVSRHSRNRTRIGPPLEFSRVLVAGRSRLMPLRQQEGRILNPEGRP